MERDILYREVKNISPKINWDGVAGIGNRDFSITENELRSGNRIFDLVKGISTRIVNIKKRQRKRYKGEREFMPTSIPGVGADFNILMDCFYDLENAAIKEGYNFDKRLSAFRKIFYDSGGWDTIIPAAASVKLPSSWKTFLKDKVKQAQSLETIQIQGYDTAVSHLFAGLDAINNKVQPLTLTFKGIPITKISSNGAQATYSGDLGSVVYEYQKARSNVSFRDMVKKRDLSLLRTTYGTYISDADMAGNADAYSLVLDKSLSIVQNLFDYYTAPVKTGVHMRYYNFAKVLMKPGSLTKIKTQLTDDIFVGSKAYAVGLKNDKSYVLLIMKDPGPGIVTPTFWEAAYNATQWVLEEFLDRLTQELDRIKI
jgi:hypothetical protein